MLCTQLQDGPTLGEIGIPDRTAADFYVPDPSPNYTNKIFLNRKEKYRQYGLWDSSSPLSPLPPLASVKDFEMPNLEDSYTTKLFDRIHAAIDNLETRLDITNRHIGKLREPPLPEPPPHQTPDPMYSQRTRRYLPHSQSRPRTPPYTSGPSSYFSPDMYGPQPYSCSDWEQLGVLSDYYKPSHERSNSSRYSV
ncbi:hypothetical protein SASPL_143842 [Salvia splendens]|uniref:Uncharacterized protein n=1 Tax=Salvia splendens TaxID=180675 RepID=A0A8X8WMK2_SALSN|nr:hypothetical protein SASPL_143842 [Salvia splendens]